MKKKLQIFISSTYEDLLEERQAAVEAILSSSNIPAGMELFKAGNNSQLETIKKWINESDIYMLILGGRYGSIELASHKSYTQLEYEYAVSKNIPVFAVVLSDSFLYEKAKHSNNIFENVNKSEYKQFKKIVMNKMIKTVNDCKDIKIAIHESIAELKEEYNFKGWIRGNIDSANTQLSEQNAMPVQKIKKSEEQINANSATQETKDPVKIVLDTKYILNIQGIEKFGGKSQSSQIEMTLLDIFINLAPLIMNGVNIDVLKSNFECKLLYKYFQNYYSLNLENEQFQNIKMQLYSLRLIYFKDDEEGNELMKLTLNGVDTFQRYCDQ